MSDEGSMKKTKYHIIVFSDEHADHRQFQITFWSFFLLVSCLVVGVISFITTATLFVRGYSHKEAVDGLSQENTQLTDANDRYLEATIELEKKLKLFEEKTAKLAQYVGVEPVDAIREGIGGAEYFDENELNQYLRYDLGLLSDRSVKLENRLDNLGETFQEHKEQLDATPSLLPARGWISSGFAYRTDPFTNKRAWHNGIDVSSPIGTPVYAPANGVIAFRGYQGGFGNLLEINHGNGITTRYAHLSKFNVSKGQRVKRGDLIAFVGTTGRSTAPHLHYEVYKDEKALNPMKYVFDESKTY
jgi:murein DD-endopeptidase MepM/ murein hydrolase activator NlpD